MLWKFIFAMIRSIVPGSGDTLCQFSQVSPADPDVWMVEYEGYLPSSFTTATTQPITMEVTATSSPEFLAEEGDVRLYFQYRGLSGDFSLAFRGRPDGLRLSWVIFDMDTRPYVDLCYLEEDGNMTCTQRTQFLVPSGDFKGQWNDFELRVENDGTEIRSTLFIGGKAFYAELPVSFFPHLVPMTMNFAPTSVDRSQGIRNLIVSNEAAGIAEMVKFGCLSEEEYESIVSKVDPSLEPLLRETSQNGRCCADTSECGTSEECIKQGCVYPDGTCEDSTDCVSFQECNAGVCEDYRCDPLSQCRSRTPTSSNQFVIVGGFAWKLEIILGKQTMLCRMEYP